MHVPCDFKTRTPRGFAYIEFVDDESAARAQQAADGMDLNGKKLTGAGFYFFLDFKDNIRLGFNCKSHSPETALHFVSIHNIW